MAEPIPTSQPIISVTLTEWLNTYRAEQTAVLTHLVESQATGFAEVKTSLQGKADKVDLERLSQELRVLAGDVSSLKTWRVATEAANMAESKTHSSHESSNEKRRNRRYALIALCFSAAVALPGYVALVFH